MLTRNRVDVERTVANVKDATDWGSKLVQKIYANPFVLSPLVQADARGCPGPERLRLAQVFAGAASKLDDAAKTLATLQARPGTRRAAPRGWRWSAARWPRSRAGSGRCRPS